MSCSLSMSGNGIVSLAYPIASQDETTKKYVDGQGNLQVARTGDTMRGALSMSGSKNQVWLTLLRVRIQPPKICGWSGLPTGGKDWCRHEWKFKYGRQHNYRSGWPCSETGCSHQKIYGSAVVCKKISWTLPRELPDNDGYSRLKFPTGKPKQNGKICIIGLWVERWVTVFKDLE